MGGLRRRPHKPYTQEELDGTAYNKADKSADKPAQEKPVEQTTPEKAVEVKKETEKPTVNISRSKLRHQQNTEKEVKVDNQQQNTDNKNENTGSPEKPVQEKELSSAENTTGETGSAAPGNTEAAASGGSDEGGNKESVPASEAAENPGTESGQSSSEKEKETATDGNPLPDVVSPPDTTANTECLQQIAEKDKFIEELQCILKELEGTQSNYNEIALQNTEKANQIKELEQKTEQLLTDNALQYDEITKLKDKVTELEKPKEQFPAPEPVDYTRENDDLIKGALQEHGASVRFPKAMYADLMEEYKHKADKGEPRATFTKVVIDRIGKTKRFIPKNTATN